MPKEKSEFEQNVASLLREAAERETLEQENPVIAATNAMLAEAWQKRGVPELDRLREIERSNDFKDAMKLRGIDWDALLRSGVSGIRVEDVQNCLTRVLFLFKAVEQLRRVEAEIAAGVNPSLQGEELHGGKHSDYLLIELRGVESAHKDILESLGRLKSALAQLRSSPRDLDDKPPIVAPGGLRGASYGGDNPTRQQTDFKAL
jgi:hypothetical protein